ncbi:MAG: NUDIX hydrolase [Chloroflexi bacterium]|nr:NUDIX hydrolase [Chloroflexota bacterium]
MKTNRILNTSKIFKGRGMSLRVDTIETSSGRSTTREIVERQDAVVILPVDRNGDVLLVRQYRYSIGRDLLELPAGMIEPGEDPEECARRELREETGYAPGKLEKLGSWFVAPGFCTEFMHFFMASDLSPSRLIADDTEDIELIRLKFGDCLESIKSGRIQDGKTIAGLLIYCCQTGRPISSPSTGED